MIARWAKETKRTLRTRTGCPVGVIHSTSRVRVPARRSSVLTCFSSWP